MQKLLINYSHKEEINIDRQEPPIPDLHKVEERQEMRKGGKVPVQSEKKETMAANVTPFRIVPRKLKKKIRNLISIKSKKGENLLSRKCKTESTLSLILMCLACLIIC